MVGKQALEEYTHYKKTGDWLPKLQLETISTRVYVPCFRGHFVDKHGDVW